MDGPNPAFGWEKADDGLRLFSVNWQGHLWNHPMWVANHGKGDTCLLFITGDLVEEPDQWVFQQLKGIGLPCAMLFDIPNQPIFGLREDDLIAHSFEQALMSGDPSWPVVFAMAKATLLAMDALQESFGFSHFIVSGGSKRGWTSWLAALSGDPRVLGLAPMVFDNLNTQAQMKHQMLQWGAFSPKLDDYTRRHLQAMMDMPSGQELASLVDPYTYLDSLRCPVHLIHGSSDPFWSADATSRYWDALPPAKSLRVMPNVGHALPAECFASLGRFAHGTCPQWSAHFVGDELHYEGPDPDQVWIVSAVSDDLHFDDKEWKPSLELPWAQGKNIAYTIEATFGDAVLNMPPKIIHGV